MRDYSGFQVWAPKAQRVTLELAESHATARSIPMVDRGQGWWEADGVPAVPGTRYAYRLDDGPALPDPRSLSQPDGVHGASEVVDPRSFTFNAPWSGIDVCAGVIYEMHVGAFTGDRASGTAGTFDSAIARLDDLAQLGVDAVEIMPVAAFPGQRGWGYDGVGLFATHAAYGGPSALARFVDAAHARGIGVILDVVYNHLGPAGNYLQEFGPYFTDRHTTPWGPAVNLDQEGSGEVRRFILDNVRQWLVDFQLDGLRLDAVHALRDDSSEHLLASMSRYVRSLEEETGRPLSLIAESDLNDPLMVTPTSHGGYGMDAQWADDIHHALHSWISGETAGYYCDFGSAATVRKTLERVFEHDGSFSTFRGQTWGAAIDPDSNDYSAHSFVAFLQDHDQVGNRAAGDRLHHSISAEQHCAVAALYLLASTTPMVFMGEEWAASAPFPFFSDLDDELGPLVTKGRTEEFARMGWSDPVPDPQSRATFESSFLDWGERDEGRHHDTLKFYARLIELRRTVPEFSDSSLRSITVTVLNETSVLMRRGQYRVLACRGGGVSVPGPVRPLALLASVGAVTIEGSEANDTAELRIEDAGVAVWHANEPHAARPLAT